MKFVSMFEMGLYPHLRESTIITDEKLDEHRNAFEHLKYLLNYLVSFTQSIRFGTFNGFASNFKN